MVAHRRGGGHAGGQLGSSSGPLTLLALYLDLDSEDRTTQPDPTVPGLAYAGSRPERWRWAGWVGGSTRMTILPVLGPVNMAFMASTADSSPW